MIEKLGITPGPWEVGTCLGDKNSGFKNNEGQIVKHSSSWVEDAWSGREADDESKANDRLIAAPEMLEALIDIAYATYDFCMNPENYPDQYINEGLEVSIREKKILLENSDFPKHKAIIEKATGKSWEEIKELL